MVGYRLPGPLGIGSNTETFDTDVRSLTHSARPGPLGVGANTPRPTAPKIDAKVRLLAATTYGEGSTHDVFEEMAAIADIKSNDAKHAKVRAGIRITDLAHNIYDIKSKDVPGEEWWRDAKGKNTRLRGKWDYEYESTAAYGGTMFWKYNADFIQATSNKVYD